MTDLRKQMDYLEMRLDETLGTEGFLQMLLCALGTYNEEEYLPYIARMADIDITDIVDEIEEV